MRMVRSRLTEGQLGSLLAAAVFSGIRAQLPIFTSAWVWKRVLQDAECRAEACSDPDKAGDAQQARHVRLALLAGGSEMVCRPARSVAADAGLAVGRRRDLYRRCICVKPYFC